MSFCQDPVAAIKHLLFAINPFKSIFDILWYFKLLRTLYKPICPFRFIIRHKVNQGISRFIAVSLLPHSRA